MTVLDNNVMTGRITKMKATFNRTGLVLRAAIARRWSTQEGRGGNRLSGNPAHPQDAGRAPALRSAEARRAGRALAAEPSMLLLDEPMAGMNVEEKQGHVPLHPRRERPVWHHHRADRGTTWAW